MIAGTLPIVIVADVRPFAAALARFRNACLWGDQPKVKRGRGGRRKRKANARARHIAAGGHGP